MTTQAFFVGLLRSNLAGRIVLQFWHCCTPYFQYSRPVHSGHSPPVPSSQKFQSVDLDISICIRNAAERIGPCRNATINELCCVGAILWAAHSPIIL